MAKKTFTYEDLSSVTLDHAWLGDNPTVDHVTEAAVKRQLAAVPVLCAVIQSAWEELRVLREEKNRTPCVIYEQSMKSLADILHVSSAGCREDASELCAAVESSVRTVVADVEEIEKNLDELRGFLGDVERGLASRNPACANFFTGEEYSASDLFEFVIDPALNEVPNLRLEAAEERCERLRMEIERDAAKNELDRLKMGIKSA